MKNKFNLLIILTFALTLISCSDDDSDSSTINGDVSGEWMIESINYTGSSVTTAQGNSITSSFEGESFDENATITFNDDNTFTSQGSYSIELTTIAFGETQDQIVEIDDYNSEGDWSLDGNIMTLDGELVSVSSGIPPAGELGNTGPQESVVQELTNDTMVLNTVSEQTVEQFGTTSEVTTDLTITLTK